MTSSTAFRQTDNSLAAGNLLQNSGVITLITRNDTNFDVRAGALTETVATDKVSDQSYAQGTGNLFVQAPVKNNPFISAANTAPTNVVFADFTSASEATTASKNITIGDANSDAVNVTLTCTAGTINVTTSRNGVVVNDETDEVVISGASVGGNIVVSYTAPVGPATVTFTAIVTDTYGESTTDTATITVSAP